MGRKKSEKKIKRVEKTKNMKIRERKNKRENFSLLGIHITGMGSLFIDFPNDFY